MQHQLARWITTGVLAATAFSAFSLTPHTAQAASGFYFDGVQRGSGFGSSLATTAGAGYVASGTFDVDFAHPQYPVADGVMWILAKTAVNEYALVVIDDQPCTGADCFAGYRIQAAMEIVRNNTYVAVASGADRYETDYTFTIHRRELPADQLLELGTVDARMDIKSYNGFSFFVPDLIADSGLWDGAGAFLGTLTQFIHVGFAVNSCGDAQALVPMGEETGFLGATGMYHAFGLHNPAGKTLVGAEQYAGADAMMHEAWPIFANHDADHAENSCIAAAANPEDDFGDGGPGSQIGTWSLD